MKKFFSRLIKLLQKPAKVSLDKPKAQQSVPLWESVKISENLYVEKIPPEQFEKWNSERRKKDNLDLLRQKEGFHFASHGRCGTIYFVNSGRVCEIDWEMSGVPYLDILIFEATMEKWHLPEEVEMSHDEKAYLRKALKAWLAERKMKADIFEEHKK